MAPRKADPPVRQDILDMTVQKWGTKARLNSLPRPRQHGKADIKCPGGSVTPSPSFLGWVEIAYLFSPDCC